MVLLKKVLALIIATVMFLTFFMTYGFADNLIKVKSDINNVTTNNKYFVISGNGQPDTYVELILNDNLNDKWVIGDTGLFAKLITLALGDNYVTLKAVKDGKVQIVKGHITLQYKDGIIRITVDTLEGLWNKLFK
ncbi:MAG: Secreted protein [Thermoanaerobacterium thermosaccharolyticum]